MSRLRSSAEKANGRLARAQQEPGPGKAEDRAEKQLQLQLRKADGGWAIRLRRGSSWVVCYIGGIR